MVEGHQCHRLAILHRRQLLGKSFTATSPNGRFTEGAKAISNRPLTRIEVVGKNLFYFFKDAGVLHFHFGMSGRFPVWEEDRAESPKPTTRLELRGHGLVGHLSAMTVQHGGNELWEAKRSALGEDPVRDDAVASRAWEIFKSSRKSVGALVMDQSVIAGVGNIYRAELLYKAGIHPDTPGCCLTESQFMDGVWFHARDLLIRGVQSGSIITVDPEEGLPAPWNRRYLYNQSSCGRCGDRIVSWSIQNRTAYACPTCQPRSTTPQGGKQAPAYREAVVFPSHCARDDLTAMLHTPEKLSVKQLRAVLEGAGQTPPKSARKAALVEMAKAQLVETPDIKTEQTTAAKSASKSASKTKRALDLDSIVSASEAALEKRRANEGRNVEHVPVE
jgi:formamidopyrimidine-DNA glycosylase